MNNIYNVKNNCNRYCSFFIAYYYNVKKVCVNYKIICLTFSGKDIKIYYIIRSYILNKHGYIAIKIKNANKERKGGEKMKIGEKICELRKERNLSQEQLSQELNVTRQTISNWELGQTSPDIYQAIEISKIFNITLDEFVDNNVKDILVEKVNKTEKIASETMKNIKILFIIIICFLVTFLIINLSILLKKIKDDNYDQALQQSYQQYRDSLNTKKFLGTINGNECKMEISYDKEFRVDGTHFNLISGDKNTVEEFNRFYDKAKSYTNDSKKMIEFIKQYFIDNGGECHEI